MKAEGHARLEPPTKPWRCVIGLVLVRCRLRNAHGPAVPRTTASPAAWTSGGGRFRLSRATRPIAAMDFSRTNTDSTSCLSCGRGGKTGLGSSQWLCSYCSTP